jgi:hypothetical protein
MVQNAILFLQRNKYINCTDKGLLLKIVSLSEQFVIFAVNLNFDLHGYSG